MHRARHGTRRIACARAAPPRSEGRDLSARAASDRATAHARSTTRFATAIAIADTSTTPRITGRSTSRIACSTSRPSPGHAKIVLGHDRAAEQDAEIEPDQRDAADRAPGAARGASTTVRARQPLRARGPDVILAERLDQLGRGRRARSTRRRRVASVIAGQHEVMEPIPAAVRRSRRAGTSPADTRTRRAAPSRRRTSGALCPSKPSEVGARSGQRRRRTAASTPSGTPITSWSSDRGERELHASATSGRRGSRRPRAWCGSSRRGRRGRCCRASSRTGRRGPRRGSSARGRARRLGGRVRPEQRLRRIRRDRGEHHERRGDDEPHHDERPAEPAQHERAHRGTGSAVGADVEPGGGVVADPDRVDVVAADVRLRHLGRPSGGSPRSTARRRRGSARRAGRSRPAPRGSSLGARRRRASASSSGFA